MRGNIGDDLSEDKENHVSKTFTLREQSADTQGVDAEWGDAISEQQNESESGKSGLEVYPTRTKAWLSYLGVVTQSLLLI